MHDPKAHSKGGTLENTINGRADEESAGAPQHIIHPNKDITKLYGMSRPCTHFYNTFYLPPPGKLSNNIRFLAWQAVYFNELLNGSIINVTVRFNRQRARKATGVVSSGKGPDKAVNSAIWTSSTLNFAKTMQYSWPMIPRACAQPLYYIYIYFSTL